VVISATIIGSAGSCGTGAGALAVASIDTYHAVVDLSIAQSEDVVY
jgi:hypothetical protein